MMIGSCLFTWGTVFVVVFIISHFIKTRNDKQIRKLLQISEASVNASYISSIRKTALSISVHGDNNNDNNSNEISDSISKIEPVGMDKTDTSKIANSFKISSSITILFTALCSTLITLHFFNQYKRNNLWIKKSSAIDDETDSTEITDLNYEHMSSTITWFISKCSLILFFNGRLYYTFTNSLYHVHKYIFMFINIITILVACLSLFIGYIYALIIKNNNYHYIYAECMFQSFRIVFLLLTLSILYMFTTRLRKMTRINQNDAKNLENQRTVHSNSVITISQNKHQSHCTQSPISKQKQPYSQHFKEITIKNAILVIIIVVAVCFDIIIWFLWISDKTSFSIAVPMLITNIEGFINTLCILMLFHFGNNTYNYLFGNNIHKYCHEISL